MSEDKLLKTETISIKCEDGKERKYILSDFPAVQGLRIVAAIPFAAIPKIGDLTLCLDKIQEVMSYVAVETNGVQIRLTTEALINNHCPDWETYLKVAWAMLEKNCSFFRDGRSSDLFEHLTRIVTEKVLETSIRLSEQLSPTTKPHTTN